VIVRSVVN